MTVEILDSKKEPLLNTEFMSSNNNVIQLSVISYYGIFAEKGRRVYLKIEKSSVEAYYRNLLKEAEQNFSISQLEKVESLRTIFPLENIPDTIKSRAFQYYKSLAQKNNNKGDLNSALWCARKALDYSDENTVNHDKMLKIYKAIEERKKQFESEQEEIDEFVDKQKYKEALNSLSKLKQNYNDNEEIEDRIEEVNKQIDKLENEISVIETQINKLMSQNRYDEAIFMIKDKIDSSTYIKKELSQRELGIESVSLSAFHYYKKKAQEFADIAEFESAIQFIKKSLQYCDEKGQNFNEAENLIYEYKGLQKDYHEKVRQAEYYTEEEEDYYKALELYESLLKLYPNNKSLITEKHEIIKKIEEIERQLAPIKKVLDNYIEKHDYDKAVSYIESEIKKDPKLINKVSRINLSPEDIRLRAYFHYKSQALKKYRRSKFDEAKNLLRTAKDYCDKNEENYNSVVEKINEIEKKKSEFIERKNEALGFKKIGEFKKALTIIKALNDLYPKNENLQVLIEEVRQEQYKTEKKFSQVIDETNNLIRKKQYKKAIKLLENELEEDIRLRKEISTYLSDVIELQGIQKEIDSFEKKEKYKEALKFLDIEVKKRPSLKSYLSDKMSRIQRLNFELEISNLVKNAEKNYKSKNYNQALDICNEVLEKKPSHKYCSQLKRECLYEIYLIRGDQSLSSTSFERALNNYEKAYDLFQRKKALKKLKLAYYNLTLDELEKENFYRYENYVSDLMRIAKDDKKTISSLKHDLRKKINKLHREKDNDYEKSLAIAKRLFPDDYSYFLPKENLYFMWSILVTRCYDEDLNYIIPNINNLERPPPIGISFDLGYFLNDYIFLEMSGYLPSNYLSYQGEEFVHTFINGFDVSIFLKFSFLYFGGGYTGSKWYVDDYENNGYGYHLGGGLMFDDKKYSIGDVRNVLDFLSLSVIYYNISFVNPEVEDNFFNRLTLKIGFGYRF